MSDQSVVPHIFQLTVQRSVPVECASIAVCHSVFPPGSDLVKLGGHGGAVFGFVK
jgi:hypothetical protein